MCGIFAAPQRELVAEVLDAMYYRGPDDSRIVEAGGLCVGFNRLAIIDAGKAAAQQPFTSPKGRVLAFNGEIYNYKELDPDAASEVSLLASMLDEGMDPRQFVDGDYAVAYYNPSQSSMTLYRDRFGACPLYYQLTPFVAVSSEARRLSDPMEVPAHGKVVIDVARGTLEEEHLHRHFGIVSQRCSDVAVLDTLIDAVRSRARHADGAFSLALSGGLDSSLIALALLHAHCAPKESLTTFFSLKSDDLAAARTLADAFGMPLREIQVGSEGDVERLKILEHLDHGERALPTALRWRGGLRTWGVAKQCTTKVVLCGDGADELLGGYPSQFQSPVPYHIAKRCLSSVRSMPSVNLDRTNKLGMAHSVEFRSPFLASTLSFLLLSYTREKGKPLLRRLLRYLGAPKKIYDRTTKYSPDELEIERTPF